MHERHGFGQICFQQDFKSSKGLFQKTLRISKLQTCNCSRFSTKIEIFWTLQPNCHRQIMHKLFLRRSLMCPHTDAVIMVQWMNEYLENKIRSEFRTLEFYLARNLPFPQFCRWLTIIIICFWDLSQDCEWSIRATKTWVSNFEVSVTVEYFLFAMPHN